MSDLKRYIFEKIEENILVSFNKDKTPEEHTIAKAKLEVLTEIKNMCVSRGRF